MTERPEEGTEDVFRPDADEFRRTLGQFATGVTIITAIDDGEPVGVAANSFTSVSLDPPLVLFCVARASSTWPRIERARKFAVNILGEHQEEMSKLFAIKGADRFGQADWHEGVGGSPVLHETLAYLDCEFWAEYDGGDHIIVVGRVLDLGMQHDAGPLLFFRGQYGRIAPSPLVDGAGAVSSGIDRPSRSTPAQVAALDGRVVVVSIAEAPVAHALAARGAAIVLVGTDAEAVGAGVEELAAGGARVCAFVGDPADDADAAALAEMVAELFPANAT